MWYLDPCLSLYILFIFIVIFQVGSSSQVFLKIMWYYSRNALLYIVHDTQLFLIFFYYKRNEKWNEKFGISLFSNISKCDAHFGSIISSILSNLCIFYGCFLPILSKDNIYIILLIQKHISVKKTFSSYKIYMFVHHSLKEPYL